MSDSDSDESVTHLNIAIDFREDPADYPPIFIAARDGDVQALRAELAAGVDPNLRAPSHSHTTPLGVIVANGVDQRGWKGLGGTTGTCRALLK